jgi:peptidoglycan-associated lipoprotein
MKILAAVLVLLVLAACAHNHPAAEKPAVPAPPASKAPTPVQAEPTPVEPTAVKPVTLTAAEEIQNATIEQLNQKGYVKDVFFDYDKYDLKTEFRDSLEQNASFLSKYPTIKILIEGHCDERGTVEYNLALGTKRAEAAKQYLTNLGVNADRIRTISYGKEKPFATCPNESCWGQNRRAHFVIESK